MRVETCALDLHSARPAASEAVRMRWKREFASTFHVIATARLRLRPLEPSDISPLVAIASDRHVADAAIDILPSYTAPNTRAWIEFHSAEWDTRASFHWTLSLLADDRLVGYTGLLNIDPEARHAEISFLMSREAVRRGYATEATQAALAFAFATLGMDRISASHVARNRLAARILTAIGMQQTDLVHRAPCKGRQFEDIIISGLSRLDWLESLSAVPKP
jgi:[ribosomal protein S5]-alanine N-acetyltransferase